MYDVIEWLDMFSTAFYYTVLLKYADYEHTVVQQYGVELRCDYQSLLTNSTRDTLRSQSRREYYPSDYDLAAESILIQPHSERYIVSSYRRPVS